MLLRCGDLNPTAPTAYSLKYVHKLLAWPTQVSLKLTFAADEM